MSDQQSIKEVLSTLGYKLREDGKFWRMRALYRNGSNDNSISMYKDSGVWTDFGAGLSNQPLSKLLDLHGIKDINIKTYEPKEGETIEEIEDAQIEKVYPESSLERLLKHYKFYIERGISADVLARLKSGMASQGKMYQRYVFPIFNIGGKIIGFSGRYMGSNPDRPKWKHIGKKKNWVYPLYVKDNEGELFVKNAIEKTGEIILVESIGDALSFHTRGIYNVLVSFGLNISAACICAILELSPKRIVLAYNNDSQKGEDNNTGKIASIENFLILLKYFDYNSIGICLPVKKDFGEMNDVDFNKWLKKKESTNYDEQRDRICALAKKYRDSKKISEKSFKNYKLLECEQE